MKEEGRYILTPARPRGDGRDGGRRFGKGEVRQAVRCAARCRRPKQQEGHAAAALGRTVEKRLCCMADLPGEEDGMERYIWSALSPYRWQADGPVLDDAVVVLDIATAVPT